ncbi:bifunctional tRNA (5-methylaminomethyl-2-thiouridine)(34)-methyltransferase MnmD/FAD-dependent 5-carboxymethylaminomethyl-2-thiouridine(34) oxidoreductase MnmC [Thalassotalea fusca]
MLGSIGKIAALYSLYFIFSRMPNKAKIIFQDDGSPYSEEFDDIYFDTESGFLQSEQVFVNGNNISQRLINAKDEFTIAETGFGTGLNFLLTLAVFHELSTQHALPKLHFVSTEKYPLSKVQLKQSLSSLSSLTEETESLLSNYPDALTENTTMQFLNGAVRLTILVGDATAGFEQLPVPRSGLVDAWYLDGFSPAKNPDMWQPKLFEQMARLSKQLATVSTFTVAGIVRRGLVSAGFRVQKQGYGGKKKEILIGKFQQSGKFGQGYKVRPLYNKPQHVTIIGGGIASACAAYFLVQQDIKVTILSRHKALAQGASSNKIGAIYPLLHQVKDGISLFHHQAFEFALDFYHSLIAQGLEFSHGWTGLLELAHSAALKSRQQQFTDTDWPSSLVYPVDHSQASELANMPLADGGLYMPRAGWIAPAELVTAILKACEKTRLLKLKFNVNVDEIFQQENGKWLLSTNKGQLKASTLVLAGGAEMLPLNYFNQLPFSPVRGQVSEMQTNANMAKLKTVICHKGYITPAHNQLHCIGATFNKNTTDITSNKADDEYNLEILNKTMPGITDWTLNDVVNSNARIRCMTPDHLPVVGPMPNIAEHLKEYAHLAKDKNWRYQQISPSVANLFVLSGLGARGLCSAPLLANILISDICGTPYPIDNHMLFNVSANRFVIRDIIKRKVNVDE